MIYWFFPVMVLMAGATAIGKRETREYSPLLIGLLDSGFLLPWIAALRPDLKTLPLLSLFLVSGSWLMLSSILAGKIKAEAFTKVALSWLLGFIFLLLPFVRVDLLLWPLSVEAFANYLAPLKVACITAGLFLLWGLPPTQVGVIDAGDVSSRESHIRSTLTFRMTLVFCLFVSLPSFAGMVTAKHLQMISAFCFVGLAISRMVAGVQISVQRSLSYLSQGLLLPVLMLMGSSSLPPQLQEYEAFFALLQGLIWASLYSGYRISEAPKHLCWDDPEARLHSSVQRLPGRLRNLLLMEALAVLLYLGAMAYFGNYRLLPWGLLFVLASLSVARDPHAFAGRGQNSSS